MTAVPASPTAPPRAAGRTWFPCLDGLRAVAALAVVVFHVTGSVAPFRDWTGGGLLARLGNWGVAVFFVLSGFLLYRPFARAMLERRPPAPVGDYLVRRIVRIVPAYWVALTVLLVLVRDDPPDQVLPYMLFYGFAQNFRSGYVDQGGGLSVAWTLSIEMTFYLVLPVLAWLVARLVGGIASVERAAHVATVAILAVAVASVGLRWWVIREVPLATFWLPSYLLWFGLGMAMSVQSARTQVAERRPPTLLWALGRYPGLSWALGLSVFLLTTLIPVRVPIQTRTELVVIFVANGLSAALLLAPAVFGDQGHGPLRLALRGWPLRWTGEISYGIYLWHTVLLTVVVGWVADGSFPGGTWPRLVIVLLFTLAAAQVSYLLVERPLLTLVHRRGSRAVAAPPAAA